MSLGPNPLSLLEFETWQIRALRHHGQFTIYLFNRREQNGTFLADGEEQHGSINFEKGFVIHFLWQSTS